ncbi:hypothetical protein [Actinophytocola xanthii]|uniref:Uncharacterized protein n=1 Tax=Actinophytocola xanthii TaxID=1912961 RepID=A0A1Q8C3I5_9PSEU|nr:hypothetical protein [Actinophytocola xanthii]OLF08921.1 hypothetical protein BU204_33495 [Actinophytocola xanthii]
MRAWPNPDSGEVPSPSVVAAWVTLGLIATERIPLWAAHWLVLGHDGDSLAALAGVSGMDPHEVHDLLPAALANCGAPIPNSVTAAAEVVFVRLAGLLAENRVGERWVLDSVIEILRASGWEVGVIELPLGQIFDLSDEWGSDWGRPRHELEQEIRDACELQLAPAGRP